MSDITTNENAWTPLQFERKDEIIFLTSEIRSAQAQGSGLLAAVAALFVFVAKVRIPFLERVGESSQYIKVLIFIPGVIVFAMAAWYFIASLRIAGIRARAPFETIEVRLMKLRKLTKRAYIARTVAGSALLAVSIMVYVLIVSVWLKWLSVSSD